MKVHGEPRRTISLSSDGFSVEIIDQRRLPHRFALQRLQTREQAAAAISEMQVRGAPLIGVTAAYGVALGMRADASDDSLAKTCELLVAARPTAVNLAWAVRIMQRELEKLRPAERAAAAYAKAALLAEADVRTCRALGEHGAALLEGLSREKQAPLKILTHCNAGWLATVDYGTALAPVYVARERGFSVEVWVEETRPRNQGLLTAWELGQEGVPHRLIADNAGGHLMQRGLVDVCIVGTDRTTRRGDVANKIGTYLKALAARDSGVPFWVALPSSSYDAALEHGAAIPIEERDQREVLEMTGVNAAGELTTVRLAPPGTEAVNPAFDVTPAELVDRFITERGSCTPQELESHLGPS